MKLSEIEPIVYELNSEIYENDGMQKLIENYGEILEIRSTGFATCIIFLGFQIWNTEDDERETYDNGEYKSLSYFLRKKIIFVLETLSKLKVEI